MGDMTYIIIYFYSGSLEWVYMEIIGLIGGIGSLEWVYEYGMGWEGSN